MPERCRRIAGNSEVIHVPDKRVNRKLSRSAPRAFPYLQHSNAQAETPKSG